MRLRDLDPFERLLIGIFATLLLLLLAQGGVELWIAIIKAQAEVSCSK